MDPLGLSTLLFGNASPPSSETTRARFTGTHVQVLFDTLDADKDGTVSQEEFVALMIVSGVGGDESFNSDARAARLCMEKYGVQKGVGESLNEAEFELIVSNLAKSLGRDVAELSTALVRDLNEQEE